MAHNSLPVPLSPDFNRSVAELGPARHPWIYPQLLSLDTPLIAVSWQVVFARAFHVDLSASTLTVLALCVWAIYAADHLLDVKAGSCYSERHEFVWRHRKSLSASVAAAVLVAAVMLLQLPRQVLLAGISLSIAVMIYFAAVHSPIRLKRFFPKEAAVALLFSAGSSIAVWSSAAAAKHAWTTLTLFAMLCLINCCMVDVKESRVSPDRPSSPHIVTEWLGRRATASVAAVLIGICGILALGHADTHLRLALAATSAALCAVSLLRRRLSADAFRFAADLALLVPALLALL